MRRAFDGTGPYSGLAAVSWLAGIVMLCAILMSPSGWAWWMDVHSVQGHELDGLVYYTVDGANYTINDPTSYAGGRPGGRTVYYLTSDPGDGSLHNTGNQLLDWGLTAGPGILGAALLATGFAKRRTMRRRAETPVRPDAFGQGIPPETIRAIMSRHARGPTDPKPH